MPKITSKNMPKNKQNRNNLMNYYSIVKKEQEEKTSKLTSVKAKKLIPDDYYSKKLSEQLKKAVESNETNEANGDDLTEITILHVPEDFGIVDEDKYEEVIFEKDQKVSIDIKINIQ